MWEHARRRRVGDPARSAGGRVGGQYWVSSTQFLPPSPTPGPDFIYTDFSGGPGFDFIYTVFSGSLGLDVIHTNVRGFCRTRVCLRKIKKHEL